MSRLGAHIATAWLCAASIADSSFAAEQLPQFFYRTSVDCLRCHTQGAAQPLGVATRIAMNEADIWRAHDKHSNAFQTLSEPRAQRMGKLLQKDVVDKSTGCIGCHATNVDPAAWLDPDPGRAAAGLAEGVGCEACHGASSAWDAEHRLPRWRTWTAEQKLANYGFVPLDNPIARAEVCLSCHLGSARHGRVITHEMYAAGHPPLSGFEPESAVERMPPHWSAKTAGITASGNFGRTRRALIASVVGVRTAVELIENVDESSQNASWPELARLECFGCHHDLQSGGWRQLRQRQTRAGRTELALGCVPLARLAAEAAGPQAAASFDATLRNLRAPFDENAFGDASQLKAAAPDAVQSLRDIEGQIAAASLDRQQVAQLFLRLVHASSREPLDYDAARQMSGAAIVILRDLQAGSGEPAGPAAEALNSLVRDFHLAPDGRRSLEPSILDLLELRAQHSPIDCRQDLGALQPTVQP